VESLERYYNQLKSRGLFKEAAAIGHRLGQHALIYKSLDHAESYLQEAIAFSRSARMPGIEADCLFELTHLDELLSRDDLALERSRKAIDLYKSVGDVRGEANCRFGLAKIILHGENSFFQARSEFIEAGRQYERISDVLGQVNSGKEVAVIDGDLGKIREAIAKFGEIGSIRSVAGTYMDLAHLEGRAGNLLVSMSLLDEAQELARPLGHINHDAVINVRRGQLMQALGRYEEGVHQIQAGMALYRALGRGVARSMAGLEHLERALSTMDLEMRAKELRSAKASWAGIGRFDLIRDWIDWLPAST
jgi:tetratricopeptide (TPR) repeat protein